VEGSAWSVALLEATPPTDLIAPDLVLVELLNAGWKAQRIGAITETQFAAIAELAPSLFSELVLAAALLSSAQRWCRQLDHPAYDCLYLALAEQRSAVLLTQDQRLLRKLESVPDAADLAMPLERWQG
jgi:predicted nucleic acid-binding protein